MHAEMQFFESFPGEFEDLYHSPHNYCDGDNNCAGNEISAQTLLKIILVVEIVMLARINIFNSIEKFFCIDHIYQFKENQIVRFVHIIFFHMFEKES